MTDAQRLIKLTAKLYDAKTPANKRADLSLEISFLRRKVFGAKADMEKMMRASKEEET